jgi:membrane protease YdiL (CAAX protease family)
MTATLLKFLLHGILLLLLVYVPAFALVSAIRPPLDIAVPAVIGITLAIALAVIFFRARTHHAGFAAFGFARCDWKFLGLALLVAVPLSAVCAFVLARFPGPDPLSGLRLAPWALSALFLFAAPIQEETIFRGLLQSDLLLRTAGSAPASAMQGRPAIVVAAALFAAVHFAVGPLTALFAAALGLAAGYLRNRSGSLLPAIACHVIFNAPGVIAAFAH